MLETVLAWMTLAAGTMIFCLVAGPASHRPFAERFLMWNVSMSLIGASLFRIVAVYDPLSAIHAMLVGYVIMFISRGLIACLCLYLISKWVARCSWWRRVQQAQEIRGMAMGYKR